MTNKRTVASIKFGIHDMTKTQNLPQFSLNCHPIHLGIHKDPSKALAYDILMAARVVAGIVS